MNNIVSISERGQITIPKALRDKIAVTHLVFEVKDDDSIVLTPLQTREDFLKELENAKADYKKNGGLTIKEIKEKYKTKS